MRSVHATAQTREMCAVRGMVSSHPAQNYGHKEKNAMGCHMFFKKMGVLQSSSVLVLRLLEKMSSLVRISGHSNERQSMTVIDHHCTMGSPNCTNSTIATVKSACAAAAVVAAAVVVSVWLQMDRRLEHVATLSLLLYNQSVFAVFASISSIKSAVFSEVFSRRCFSVAFV